MYSILRSLLFLLPAETAHHFTLFLLEICYKLPFGASILKALFNFENKGLERNIWGLNFKNPVGLAAGFDKNAKHIDALACLGFGFIEIGTVTPLAQEGNPLPRLFRLKKDEAIINRMGFNNEGVDAVVERLKKRKSKIIIGGNIGKNKLTPNENAVDDYLICFNKLFDYVDYFVVNVSSPNTPNLRALQEKDKLFAILNTLQVANSNKPTTKPILLKIAPDLNEAELNDVLSVVRDSKIAGLISSNTTIDRSGLLSSSEDLERIGNGGLSGKPVLIKANSVLDYLNKNNTNNTPIIAVGGIASAQDALKKMDLGAQLIQVYTGFIYEGPGLIKRINKAILNS
ncbi:MAG: quinone-dependent dihydroorotate dehydrogenase [Chitinophagales bacterium]|nr:quinone-dependent dihydroorotate dehydrogenase [Chitinophagales bacterium]